MGVCVPQHIVCDWFAPNFTAGSAPCTLQLFDERRSRLSAGNCFFRSKAVGPRSNNIRIESVWLTNTLDGSFQPIGPIVGTSDPDLMNSVWVKVFNGITLVENWYASQTYSDPNWSSGHISMAAQINGSSSSLITMNVTDVHLPWPQLDGMDDPIVPEYLGNFPVRSTSGASGGPEDPNSYSPRIRTGPALSIILIRNSEINNADGTMRQINKTRYWNGACWLAYDPNAPDCADPDNPQGCDEDPATKCPV